MNEIKVAENKTLKLTNVLSRLVRPEELGNLPVILTQMQNFMKSNGAQPYRPAGAGGKDGYRPGSCAGTVHDAAGYPDDHPDGARLPHGRCAAGEELSVRHYTGPMSHNQLATAKLQIMAFENDIKLTGDNYTIYVNQDDDDAVI